MVCSFGTPAQRCPWFIPGVVRAVPAHRPGREHPADPAAVHLPGPDPVRGVVVRLPLHPLCHVQARDRPGKHLDQVRVPYGVRESVTASLCSVLLLE